MKIINWLRGLDLNQGPSGYEPDELPDCSTPRIKINLYNDNLKFNSQLIKEYQLI